MNDRELKSIIEAVLYVWAEPIHINEIMNIINADKKKTKNLLDQIKDECEHYRRGITLNEYNEHYQFSTRKEHSKFIENLIKNSNKRISNSAMEVLALIAYNQPITRVEIDDIRGVKSYSSIETLKNKGLIKEVGKANTIGKPIKYGTTIEFLRAFDIDDLNKLPEIEEFEKIQNILVYNDED